MSDDNQALAAFLEVYQAPEHEPFLWTCSPAAALLIHGFPGTPAEMRPLAQHLYDDGWTVQGLLLPGFGREIETLAERHWEEWVAAAGAALAELQRSYDPVIVVGHSMGAAVALNAAAQMAKAPDALVLFSPFWRLVDGWIDRLWPVIRVAVPRFRPFRLMKPDFDDPETRKSMAQFMPDADLDDPAAREAILDFTIPTRMLDQLRRVGRSAYAMAPQVPEIPKLILQGSEDEVVPAARTRALLQRLSGPLEYQEFAGAHDLLNAEAASWAAVTASVPRFLHRSLGEVPRSP